MKVKSFCFYKTEGANNNIKQGDPCFFARNTVGVTDYRPIAMLTSVIHDWFSLANKMPYQDYFVTLSHREIRGLNGLRRHFVHQTRMAPTVMDAGNSRRGLNSCKLIFYKNSLVVCERTVGAGL